MTLPAGLYRLDNMQISEALIYDDIGLTTGLQGCGLQSITKVVDDDYTDNSVWFTVVPGVSKVIRFEFNVDAFEALFSPGIEVLNDPGQCDLLEQNIETLIPIVEVGG
jgi:hypothetical protein